MDVVEFLRSPDRFTRLGGKLPKVSDESAGVTRETDDTDETGDDLETCGPRASRLCLAGRAASRTPWNRKNIVGTCRCRRGWGPLVSLGTCSPPTQPHACLPGQLLLLRLGV